MGKSRWREILAQIEVWKAEEYFVYFPVFKLKSWVKRSASCRRRFIQRFPKFAYPDIQMATCRPSFLNVEEKSAISR